jgi:hypothetical protein
VRRYAELGNDVTRSVTDDDIALGLAYLPLWIAEPAHYARWFEVRAKSANEVALHRMVARGPGQPKPELAFVLAFDSAHHLVAIRDAKGTDLVTITWGNVGPSSARVGGEDIKLGFSGLPITDVVSWAHGSSTPGIAVEMPMHLPAYWDAKLATLSDTSAEWRHAQRQKMASLAAINDRANLFKAYDALRTHGGALLGDLALASAGIAGGTTDAQLATALEKVKDQPIAQYIQASRNYAQVAKSERMKAKTSTGFVGALWTLREITALYVADKDTQAVDRLLSLGERAAELRLAAVGMTANRYRMKPADIVRAWDSIAKGQYKNIARAQAAQLLANRSQYDAAAERVAALVDGYDLDAYPAQLSQMQYSFSYSRRGSAGWQLVWATLRDKILAKGSYEHVAALLPMATSHPIDLQALLVRAAKLAGDDVDRVMWVAQMAISYNQPGFGYSLVEPLVKKHPTRELLQLVAGVALQQGRQADALAHLEAAQDLGGDEAVQLSTLRSEMTQIIAIAKQLAVSSQGADRTRAVQKALAWGKRWRAIDPGNSQIDQQMGEVLLAVGDTSEAWRHLSSVIERDPMSGDGYQTVAQTFENQGRVAEAVSYWHMAVIIDQTNPTPRMREAQALIALGKTADGDKLLEDIVARKWHVRWDGVVYQVKSMLERAKRGNQNIDSMLEE